MKLAINASRARSGGAKAHLIGILKEGNLFQFGFKTVHVWGNKELLDELPNVFWLIKHCPSITTKSIVCQLFWERFYLPLEVKKWSCDLLFNVDAGSICNFQPSVTMSQDMLAFEPGEVQRLGYGKSRLRQFFLRRIQCRSLTKSNGIIFLTNYAAKVIQNVCGFSNNSRIIPHGVGLAFDKNNFKKNNPNLPKTIELLYVSPIVLFKHQWHVVKAIKLLRDKGFPVHLTLVGKGERRALNRLQKQCDKSDPYQEFTSYIGELPHTLLPIEVSKADIIIFASSCENMPITLLEAMKMGKPIACSNRGPMPEILQQGGVYFNPEDSNSIAVAVESLIIDNEKRMYYANQAYKLAQQYSWHRCATETYEFLAEIIIKNRL